MSAPLLAVLVAVAAPAVSGGQVKVTNPGRTRTVRELMVSALDEPSVQVAIGVSSTQSSLRDLRLSREATKFGLSVMRATVQHNDEGGAVDFATQFGLNSAKALLPFLSANQVAKLQRLAIAHFPEAALGTDEVAFALALSPAQRARIEALRVAKTRKASSPNSPAMRALSEGLAKAAVLAKKADEKDGDGNITVESINTMEAGLNVIYDAFERSLRLGARQPAITGPDPLAVLTSAQRRRFRELSAGSLASGKSRRLLAGRG